MHTRKKYGGVNSSSKPSTRSGKPSTRSGKPSTRSGKPSTRSGKPSTRSGKPSTRSGKSSIRSGKPSFYRIKLTNDQCKLPPKKCLNVKPTQADMEEISKYSRISLSEIKKAFKQTDVKRISAKKSLSMHTSSSGRGLWKGPLPPNVVQNSICILLLIIVGTSVGYVIANPALRMLTWVNWLPELCRQDTTQWITRTAASHFTGVLTCHEAAEKYRSQLNIMSTSLIAAGITQELLLHHYSLAKDAVKAHLFGTPAEQRLVNTRIAAAKAQRQAHIAHEQLRAEKDLAQAHSQIHAAVAASPVASPVAASPVASPVAASPVASPVAASPVASPVVNVAAKGQGRKKKTMKKKYRKGIR